MFLAYSTSYFWGFLTSFLSLFWIIFQVVFLFLPCLFGLVSFYLVSSFVKYFYVFSFFFFLTYSIWSLLFPDFRVVSLLPFGFCSQWERLFSGLCWFLVRGELSLCCSGGSELFYLFIYFFLMEKAVWGSIIWSVCVNPLADIVFCFCLASWSGKVSYRVGRWQPSDTRLCLWF